MAGLMDKFSKMWNPPDDEYEYEDYPEEAEPEEKTVRTVTPHDEQRRGSISSFSSFSSTYSPSSYTPKERNYVAAEERGKVVNINAKTQLQVVVSKPSAFGDEVLSIADELLRRHTVVLNLEKTDKDVSRRIVDFLGGVAYANNGKIKRIATATFNITPYNVDLTGDVLDELESSGLYF